MKPLHRLCRRSFLGRVAGGAILTGSLGVVAGGEARAMQVTDRGPTDPVGRGRGGGTGITDSDSGVGADPAGRGRGGPPRPGATGVTDSDSGAGADPVGRGRGGSGITDSDGGPYADPRGRGRGGQRGASGNDGLSPEARAERCRNNQQRFYELSRDGATPETWSEGQLNVARADLSAVEGARAMLYQDRAGDPAAMDRAWAIVAPIAQRYGFATSRQQDWYYVQDHIHRLIRLAENSPARAERLRQLELHRTNLAALGC